METQETHSSPSNSVLLQKPFEGSSSFSPSLPVPEETLAGSSPLSLSETKGDHALVPLLDSVTGSSSILDKKIIDGCSSAPSSSDPNLSSPSLPLKTLVDRSWAPQSSLGVGSSAAMVSREIEDGAPPSTVHGSPIFGDNYESRSNSIGNEEEGPEDNYESPPSSPFNLVGNNLSNYDSHWQVPGSSTFSPWSSQWPSWSSSKEKWDYSESSFSIQETKPSMVVRVFFIV